MPQVPLFSGFVLIGLKRWNKTAYSFVENLLMWLTRENPQDKDMKLVHILAQATDWQGLFLSYIRDDGCLDSWPNMKVLYENEVYTEILLSFHRIREHIADKAKLPVLIFPEGRKQIYWFYCFAHSLPLSSVYYPSLYKWCVCF